MDLKKTAAKVAAKLNNTYIKQDVSLRTSVMRGKDDPAPKSGGASFSLKLTLAEAGIICAGAALTLMIIGELHEKMLEMRIEQKLRAQNADDDTDEK